jgi:hypothetical protein
MAARMSSHFYKHHYLGILMNTTELMLALFLTGGTESIFCSEEDESPSTYSTLLSNISSLTI